MRGESVYVRTYTGSRLHASNCEAVRVGMEVNRDAVRVTLLDALGWLAADSRRRTCKLCNPAVPRPRHLTVAS